MSSDVEILQDQVDLRAEIAMRYFQAIPKNTEFKVAEHVSGISSLMGIPEQKVLKILLHPPIHMFPDVPGRIRQIGDCGGFPIVWTQGHIGHYDMRQEVVDLRSIGFQPVKIIASGLADVMRPYVQATYRAGFDPVIGGENKNDTNILQKVLSLAVQNGIQDVVAVDDVKENLEALSMCCTRFGRTLYSYWMNMRNDPYPRDNSPYYRARSFHEIPLIPGALYLLDLDRTTVDTDSMKPAICRQLAEASFN